MADVIEMKDEMGAFMKGEDGGFVINPDTVEEYEAPAPFQRFMKLLIDGDTFPGTPFSIALIRYPSGAGGPFHSHRETTEVYFVLEGELMATVGGKEYQVKRGELIYIPPSAEHRAENRGKETCRFMAINSPLSEDVTETKVRQTWKKVSRKNS
jgi:mannose-6-phosphate isomerase-like protein (cupin superfamily)